MMSKYKTAKAFDRINLHFEWKWSFIIPYLEYFFCYFIILELLINFLFRIANIFILIKTMKKDTHTPKTQVGAIHTTK
jgi:hypothetical protein